jgi:NADP-dependent 3-hydroxy acid dehydrogenase YdfG
MPDEAGRQHKGPPSRDVQFSEILPCARSRKACATKSAARSASSVARAIAYEIEQPADVDINEIVLRPTVQDF